MSNFIEATTSQESVINLQIDNSEGKLISEESKNEEESSEELVESIPVKEKPLTGLDRFTFGPILSLPLRRDYSKEDTQSDHNTSTNIKARKCILFHLLKGNYSRAKEYAEVEYQKAWIALKNFNGSFNDLFDLIQDFLMYVKCLLCLKEDIDIVKEVLSFLSNKVLKDMKVNYTAIRGNFKNNAKTEVTSMIEVRKLLKVYPIMAGMYKMLEYDIESERMYIKYCEIVEKVFGVESVQVGWCYYFLGVYYYEERKYRKSLVSMQKSLNVKRKLNKRNECGDCLYNIGLILKKLNNKPEAKETLEQALENRKKMGGEYSLLYTDVLEQLGKLALEDNEYDKAYSILQKCYEIRKRIIKDHKHIAITRISLLLIFAQRKLEKASIIESNNNSLLEMYSYEEETINSMIFILSLDKLQLKEFNESQINLDPNAPLFIDRKFRESLAEFQLHLLYYSDIEKVPCLSILKNPQEPIEPQNLLTESLSHKLIGRDEELGKIIKENVETYKILNAWQLEILTNVVSNNLPLILLFKSLKEEQVHAFEAIIKEGLIKLNSSSSKNGLQTKLVDFVKTKLNAEMMGIVVLKMNEEFNRNLSHDQLILLCKLIKMQHTKHNWEYFKQNLIHFIQTLNQREVYQFSSANPFMAHIRGNIKRHKSVKTQPEVVATEDSREVSSIEEQVIESTEEEKVEDNIDSSEEEVEEDNFCLNILRNKSVSDELKKVLPKLSLDILIENPSILKQFLVREPLKKASYC